MKMAGMKEKPGAEITKLVKMVKLVILTIFARTKNGINDIVTTWVTEGTMLSNQVSPIT
jgi:hypothetical protein